MSHLIVPVNDKDHIQGNKNAELTLLEYGDFQCPYCGEAHPVIKQVQKKLGTKMKFVFRNFPLNSIHPYAELAAEAAEAAGAQGKYWEMHDGIYENQESLGQELILNLAEKLELDQKKFVDALEKRIFQTHVKEDFMGGVKSGVNGTPAFFINGKKYEGETTEENLIEALESNLNE
jgi:protein-disulfide isomerase